MRSGQPVTEDHVSGRADLDLRSTLELVELINDEDTRVPAAVRRAARTTVARDEMGRGRENSRSQSIG